jgi:hypothetical protein
MRQPLDELVPAAGWVRSKLVFGHSVSKGWIRQADYRVSKPTPPPAALRLPGRTASRNRRQFRQNGGPQCHVDDVDKLVGDVRFMSMTGKPFGPVTKFDTVSHNTSETISARPLLTLEMALTWATLARIRALLNARAVRVRSG